MYKTSRIKQAMKTLQRFKEDMECEYCPMEKHCEENTDSICTLFDYKIDELNEQL